MRPFGTILHPDDQNLVNLRQPIEGLVCLFALGIGTFFHEHTSHCKSSALSSCDHVPNSWAPACDCANQSRGTAFVSASCLPRNRAAATADTHLLVISVK